MKNNKIPIIRKIDLWPDEAPRKHDRFFRPDNDRFSVYAILIAAILILLLICMVNLGRMIELHRMTEGADASMPTPDETRVLNVELASVTMPCYPDTADIWMPNMPLPDPDEADGSFKTYLPYDKITRTDSPQYQLQQLARTDADGLRRYEQYYLVAVGMAYSNTIGETLQVELSSGRVIDCMVGDIKAPAHTDPDRQYSVQNGDIIEFIVDRSKLDPKIARCGDVSALGFEGAVVRISKTEFKGWR